LRTTRDGIVAEVSLDKYLSRPQPGLQRRHASKASARLVSGGEQIACHLRRRLEVRGAHQRKAQIIGRPGICHEMDSIAVNGRLATQPPSRVLLDARLIWPLVIGNLCTECRAAARRVGHGKDTQLNEEEIRRRAALPGHVAQRRDRPGQAGLSRRVRPWRPACLACR